MHCSVIKHSMTSLSFQTAVQKNEAKRSCFPVFLENPRVLLKSIFHETLQRRSCWFHGPRIISASSNVVFWTFSRAKTCWVVCNAYCSCDGRTNMARKNVWKPHSIPLLRLFNFSQSGSRKNNRKPLKELPWNQQDLLVNIFKSAEVICHIYYRSKDIADFLYLHGKLEPPQP